MMDKIELIKKLTSLEGLTDEERSSLIELLQKRKKYGLVWEDSHEHAVDELKEKLPILREIAERKILNDTSQEHYPNHILIEGENLQALITLTYTHAKAFDVIYLDPPYNTGNKDFVYNDTFVDYEDSYRHSKWISFMEKRLRIARTLLSEKGVIFISIDDNEQANLKLLCDDIFGENLFVTDLIWRSSDSSNHDSKKFSVDYNHTLVYSSNSDWQPIKFERTEDNNAHYKNPDNDPNGPWFPSNVSSPNPRPNLTFDIISPQGYTIHPPKNGWRWSKEKMQEFIDNGAIIFPDGGKRLVKKTYLKDQEGLVPSNIWWDLDETGHNRNAKYELKKIFYELKTSDIFKTPKPTKFILKILELSSYKDSLILDFFAGSGTTLHSTMLLNQKDKGHRQCVLIQSDEGNICENVTYERNKRVIQGYTTPKGEQVAGLTNNNLRYYKVKGIPRDNSIRNRMKLAAGSIDMLCIMENLYQEKHSFGDMGHYKGLRYFEEEGRGMLVLLNTDLIPLIVEQLKGMKLVTPLHIYMYAPGDYAFDDEFEEVGSKVELYPLPQPILNSYKQWLPKQDEVKLEIPDDYELSEAEQNESGEDFITKEG